MHLLFIFRADIPLCLIVINLTTLLGKRDPEPQDLWNWMMYININSKIDSTEVHMACTVTGTCMIAYQIVCVNNDSGES